MIAVSFDTTSDYNNSTNLYLGLSSKNDLPKSATHRAEIKLMGYVNSFDVQEAEAIITKPGNRGMDKFSARKVELRDDCM